MTAVLPHYKQGPMNKQVSTLVIGGMIVCPTTIGSATDLTVAPCSAANTRYYLGVAGKDANTIAVQTGAANTYGQPAIDISVLDDYTAVYYGTVVFNNAATDPNKIVGKCTHPGGITAGMLAANTLIGGSTYFLGRARIY